MSWNHLFACAVYSFQLFALYIESQQKVLQVFSLSSVLFNLTSVDSEHAEFLNLTDFLTVSRQVWKSGNAKNGQTDCMLREGNEHCGEDRRHVLYGILTTITQGPPGVPLFSFLFFFGGGTKHCKHVGCQALCYLTSPLPFKRPNHTESTPCFLHVSLSLSPVVVSQCVTGMRGQTSVGCFTVESRSVSHSATKFFWAPWPSCGSTWVSMLRRMTGFGLRRCTLHLTVSACMWQHVHPLIPRFNRNRLLIGGDISGRMLSALGSGTDGRERDSKKSSV